MQLVLFACLFAGQATTRVVVEDAPTPVPSWAIPSEYVPQCLLLSFLLGMAVMGYISRSIREDARTIVADELRRSRRGSATERRAADPTAAEPTAAAVGAREAEPTPAESTLLTDPQDVQHLLCGRHSRIRNQLADVPMYYTESKSQNKLHLDPSCQYLHGLRTQPVHHRTLCKECCKRLIFSATTQEG